MNGHALHSSPNPPPQRPQPEGVVHFPSAPLPMTSAVPADFSHHTPMMQQ